MRYLMLILFMAIFFNLNSEDIDFDFINDGKIIYWSNEAFSDTYLSRPSDTELNNFTSYKFLTDLSVT